MWRKGEPERTVVLESFLPSSDAFLAYSFGPLGVLQAITSVIDRIRRRLLLGLRVSLDRRGLIGSVWSRFSALVCQHWIVPSPFFWVQLFLPVVQMDCSLSSLINRPYNLHLNKVDKLCNSKHFCWCESRHFAELRYF